MAETVERLRTALKQLILEDRRRQLTSRSENENGDLSAAVVDR
jgi:hypothetical protein